MKVLKGYLWGVSPEDDVTNEVIARELAKTCEADEQKVSDIDGDQVTLYIVDHSFITELKRVRNIKLNFQIYSKKGNNPWQLRDLSMLKKPSKKIQKIKDDLKKKRQ